MKTEFDVFERKQIGEHTPSRSSPRSPLYEEDTTSTQHEVDATIPQNANRNS